VRGFLTRSSDDRLKNTIDVAKDVVVPETQDQIAVIFQIGSPFSVAAAFSVLPTIKFDDQSRGLATEVDNVGFDRHLPAKFQSIKPAIAQPKP